MKHWKRHPDIYFGDGSVVLLAETTLFRVYWGWLGKRSDVFSQLASFDNVQPPDSETYDGCPLIRVSDTAEDLEYFLNAMDGCGQYFSPGKPTPFPVVSGVLRLASKYMVKPLQDKAIAHLCQLYPTKFEDMRADHKLIRTEIFGIADNTPEHPIIVVDLLRSCQVTKLLPWAYYATIRWSFRDMILGHAPVGGPHVRLSNSDMEVCLLGHDALLTIQLENIKHIYQGPIAKCPTWDICSEGIQEAYLRALEEHGTGLIAPLGPLRRKINACERCLANIKRLDTEKRKEVWAQLPSIFGLPPWTELLAE
ncbi:hypothetical protein K439DRAFT_1345714 [Ramaria rubella]|nr:hypothetical protein K439DRAFT_1345714 [Ramaria rubella]